jgi:hypothetical protein
VYARAVTLAAAWPEPEADYEPACRKLLGVLDEIQVLNRPTDVWMLEPAVMRAREVPGEQTTVATAPQLENEFRRLRGCSIRTDRHPSCGEEERMNQL